MPAGACNSVRSVLGPGGQGDEGGGNLVEAGRGEGVENVVALALGGGESCLGELMEVAGGDGGGQAEERGEFLRGAALGGEVGDDPQARGGGQSPERGEGVFLTGGAGGRGGREGQSGIGDPQGPGGVAGDADVGPDVVAGGERHGVVACDGDVVVVR